MSLNTPSRRISPLDMNDNVTIGVAFPLDRENLQKGTETVKEQIKTDLINLMLTEPGERLYLVNYGVGLKRIIFNTNIDISNLNNTINKQIKTYLPQITLKDVTSNFEKNEHILYIKIVYQYNLDGEKDAILLNFNKDNYAV